MITISNYHESDAPSLWEVFFNTVRHVNVRDYSQAQVEAWACQSISLELWKTRTDRIKPFVARIDEAVVGYADLQPDGLIDHFFCHYQHQGKGIAKALMLHILGVADQKQIPVLRSEVSITARPFFEHFGFHVIEEQTIQIRGQSMNNFKMQRSLVK